MQIMDLSFLEDAVIVLALNADKTAFTRSPAYYAFGHVSKFVQSGAKRVASNDTSNPSNLKTLTFINADGTGVLIIHNDRTKDASVNASLFGKMCSNVELQGYTTLSLVYDGSTVTKWESNFRNGNPIEVSCV